MVSIVRDDNNRGPRCQIQPVYGDTLSPDCNHLWQTYATNNPENGRALLMLILIVHNSRSMEFGYGDFRSHVPTLTCSSAFLANKYLGFHGPNN